MPILLQNDTGILSQQEVEVLWRVTRDYTGHADDTVTVRFVDEEESRRLNAEYRKKDTPTNVLTFSYEASREGQEHDIALCGAVVECEASERGVSVRDYLALVLVHGFLHAVGFDHERSAEDAHKMHEAEHTILKQTGFNVILWG